MELAEGDGDFGKGDARFEPGRDDSDGVPRFLFRLAEDAEITVFGFGLRSTGTLSTRILGASVSFDFLLKRPMAFVVAAGFARPRARVQ
jgi:hypothetical protein